MGYALYWARNTGAMAPQLCLEEVGAAYDRIIIDPARGEHLRSDYLAINPAGQIPALRLPDGTIITETAAMVLHLADAHPEAGLLPMPGTSARALADRWLLFLATSYYEADLRWFYPQRYTTDPTGIEGVRAAALVRMDRDLGIIDGALEPGPYLLGEQAYAVDLYLFMVALWYPARQDILPRYPRLAELLRRVHVRPSVQRIWTQHYPAEEDILGRPGPA